ncbi:hypothetical protein L195_g023438, partial [Trifolium pratense]
ERVIEVVRSISCLSGGIEHLRCFKGLVSGGNNVGEKLGAICLSHWLVNPIDCLELKNPLRFWRRSCIASVKSSSVRGPAVMIFGVAAVDVLYQLRECRCCVGDKINEVESDDDRWHSEELRSPISSNDEEDGSEILVFYQFNEATEFGHNSLEIG